VAEGKGGWISVVHQFPSTMAQNFWIAICAWTACFLCTVVVSLATTPRPERELAGLVYGCTAKVKEEPVPWYQRPVVLAGMAGAALVVLNVAFR
jgi:SSS family solute:Na+ symporter